MRTRALTLLVALSLITFYTPVYASTTEGVISPDAKYAWGENMAWVNFAPSGGGLTVTDSSVTGYAWSSIAGWINFNPTNSGQGVANTPEGVLSGSAWVAGLGWLNMDGVSINSSGKFIGTAGVSDDAVGRVSFDCDHCNVLTDWRPASVRGGDVSEPAPQGGGGGGGSSGPTYTNPVLPPPSSPIVPPEAPSLPDVLHSLGLSESLPDSTHVESYNQPLVIKPTQTGRVVKTLGTVSAAVEVPLRPGQKPITLSIDINPTPLDATIGSNYLVGGVEFNVVARDSSGAEVHHFDPPITITFAVPEPLQGAGIGVYWFDESLQSWTPVPNVTFSQSSVTFQVDHLSRFAIFKAVGSSTKAFEPTLSFISHSYISWVLLLVVLLILGYWGYRRHIAI